MRLRFLPVFALLFVLAAPSARAAGQTYDAQPQVRQYASLVYWNYHDALEKAQKMRDRIFMLIDNPTQKNLDKARTAWIAARAPYSQTEAFRFYEGPIDFGDPATQQKGPESYLNSWPVNEAYIDYVQGNPEAGIIHDESKPITYDALRNDNQARDEADVATGWHAIEFLLWGQDFQKDGPGTRSFEDFKPGNPVNDRRRLYLKTITSMLVADLSYLTASWAPGKTNNFAASFTSGDSQVALKKLLSGMATLAGFEMASERMGTGLDSGEQEDEQSCFSDNTHNDFTYNARGIKNIYLGEYGSHKGPSIATMMNEIDPMLNAKLLDQLDRTERLIADIPHPYDQVLSSEPDSPGRAKVEAAIASLQQEAELLKKVGKALGVDVEIASE